MRVPARFLSLERWQSRLPVHAEYGAASGWEGKKGLRKITSAATMHRINDTLSSALSWGIKREQAFARNWAQLVELPTATRPKPLVWTPERIAHWKRTCEKPGPILVWTPELTGQFLDFVKDDWLYELWHSFIFLGPRRGEMAALPWTEISTDALWLRISQQIVEVAYELYGEAPKADSVRTLSLSLESGDNLVSFRAKQEQKHQEWGDAYVEAGRVWTHENGEALHPDWISRRFTRLVELSGLPAGPPARPASPRGHPVSARRYRHQGGPGEAGPLLAPDHLRHLHQRAARDDAGRGRIGDDRCSPRRPLRGAYPAGDPERAWQGDIAVFFAHGARQSGDNWCVGAQPQPDSDLLGMITLAGRGQDDAANAAVKWIRDHCAVNDLELVRVENFNDRYPEEQQADFSLTRFTIARSESPGLDGWALPTGMPPVAARTARRAPNKRRTAA